VVPLRVTVKTSGAPSIALVSLTENDGGT